MASEVLISVIMPVYNAEDTVSASVNSILAQTYANLDVILVDDGSTDKSSEICDAFAAKDARVRVIHQPNKGVSAARNAGLRAAKGDYIAWLDSDDTCRPHMLETLLNAIVENGASAAVCNYNNVSDGNASPRYPLLAQDRVVPRDQFMGWELAKIASPVLWATMIPRDYYQGISFPEGKIFEDIRVTYKLFERAERVALIAEPMIDRVRHDSSLSCRVDLGYRVDNMNGYIGRYQEAATRWPQYGRAMLVSNTKLLGVFRDFSLTVPPETFKAYQSEINAICAFYRTHRREIFSQRLRLRQRLFYTFEFNCIITGSRRLFAFSAAVGKLLGRSKAGLRNLPVPDVPPLA